jgi:hypothetical protein
MAMPSVGALALRRLFKRRALAGAQMLAMALAIGVPLSLQSVTTVAGNAGYASAINVNSVDSLVTIISPGAQTADSYQQVQTDDANAVLSAVGDRLEKIAELGRIASFEIKTVNGKQYVNDPPAPNLTAAYYPALQQNAAVVSGAWPGAASPDQPIPVAFSEAGADLYGLKAGDVACVHAGDVNPPGPQVCVSVSGTWKAQGASNPFWLSGPVSTDMTLSADGYWLLQSLVKGIISNGVSVYRPNPARLTVAEAPALEAGLVRLRGTRQFAGNGLVRSTEVVTSLDRRIGDFLQSTQVNQFPIQIVGVAMICVVLYGLAFVSLSFLRSQEQQSTLWRIRGWSRARLFAFLSLHLLALVIPAAAIAIAIALASTWLVARGQGASYSITAPDLLANFAQTLALSLIGMLALCCGLTAIFSWRTVAQMRRSLGRPAPVAWWRHRNADLALGLLAIPVLIEASLRGQETVRSAVSGADPIGLVLPILGLGGLAVAELRLLPLSAPVVGRVARGVPARLTSWRIAGQPAEHAGVAILLALTLGIGVFASVYASTQTSNTLDRVAYATGADVRISLDPLGTPAVLRTELAAVHGVAAVTPILRKTVRFPDSADTITMLGADPLTFAKAAWSRPGLTTPQLGPSLQAMSGQPPVIDIPGQPTSLGLWVFGMTQAATLAAVVHDSNGQVCACSFGSVAFDGWRRLEAPLTFPSPPAYPLELHALRADSPGSGGVIALSSLDALSAAGAVSIERFEQVSGWWARESSGLMFAPGIKRARADVQGIDVQLPASGTLMYYPPFASQSVPMLMSRVTMDRFGLQSGQSVPLVGDANQVVARLVGGIDFVPTLYPDDDFIVVPLDHALSAFAAAGDESIIPNEMWLALKPSVQAQAVATPPMTGVSFVVYRTFEQSAALNDPILIQLRANLAIGFASALGLAVLGFAVHFLIATRRRLSEHAILLANGLEPDDIHRGIALEQVAVVVFGLLAGVLLAIVATFVLLPSLQLGNSPQDVIPPTMIDLDGMQLAVGGLALAVSMAIVALLTRRAGSAVNVVDELRRLG